MAQSLFQVDAFTDRPFAGNPAAVVLLDSWLGADKMQAIAAENNLSETAFLGLSSDMDSDYEIRWFTPTTEVELCGHATLASAFVLFTVGEWGEGDICFSSASGRLVAKQQEDGKITLDFLARDGVQMPVPDGLEDAIGMPVRAFHKAVMNMAVLDDEAAVRAARPDLDYIRHLDGDGLILTGAGADCDCASRYFAPHCGIDEDPVTGAAHCTIIPYWAARLGTDRLHARQVSARGGELWCQLSGNRVLISGYAALYMSGVIQEE